MTDAARVADLIDRHATLFTFTTEHDLHDAVEGVLRVAGEDVQREYRLPGNAGRLDLFVDGVAIELKVDGTWFAVTRQLARYAKSDHVHSLILVTTKTAHVQNVPQAFGDVPVHFVLVGGMF